MTFGGVAATVTDVAADGSTVTVLTPGHAAGTVDIVVTTPGGETTSPNAFTYVAPPTASEISPDAGPLSGGPAGSVAIDGTNFVPGLDHGRVRRRPGDERGRRSQRPVPERRPAGPRRRARSRSSSSRPAASTDPADVHLRPAADRGDDHPDRGPAAGGTPVTITGTNFIVGETNVLFDDMPATNVVVTSPTTLTAVTPADSAGPADVVVAHAGRGVRPAAHVHLRRPADGQRHRPAVRPAGRRQHGGRVAASVWCRARPR